MAIVAMVSGSDTTYPATGLALGAGNTFTVTASFQDFFISDDDATFNGDQAVNETPDDLNQTINQGGVDVPIGYDYAFQASAGGVVYSFATVDVDLNNDGDFGNGTVGGADPGENVVYLAVLGPSTPVVPPGGLTFTVTTTVSENTNQPFSNFICFASGTRLLTKRGYLPVEALSVGDLVWTEAQCFEPVRWVGSREVDADGRHAPVSIGAGAFGNKGELVVSQQHRVLLEGRGLELVTGEAQALAKAVDLLASDRVYLKRQRRVGYHHILLERHAMVLTKAGFWAETLYPGMEAMRMLDPEAYTEVVSIFPELGAEGACDWDMCRPLLKRGEVATAIKQDLRLR